MGEIWDYFMRQKLLLLSVIAVSTFIGAMGYKLCFGQTVENVIIDVPKTGEVIVNESEASCVAELTNLNDGDLGGGVNQSELSLEDGAEITFWGAEVPDADIKIAQPEENAEKTNLESLIITVGVIATVAVIFLAKFIFDRYVR